MDLRQEHSHIGNHTIDFKLDSWMKKLPGQLYRWYNEFKRGRLTLGNEEEVVAL